MATKIIKKHYLEIMIIVFSCFIIVFKSFVGLNWRDECFYLGKIRCYAEGYCPIIDEWSVIVYPVIFVPLYKLYVLLGGSDNGIILLVRLAMNLLVLINVIVLRHELKKDDTKGSFELMLVSCLQLFFELGSIHGPSYYMLSFISVQFILMLQLYAERNEKKRSLILYLCGVSAGVSVLCNPVFLFFLILFAIVEIITKRTYIKDVIFVWIGIANVGLYFLCFVVRKDFSYEHLKNFLSIIFVGDEKHSAGGAVGHLINFFPIFYNWYFLYCGWIILLLLVVILLLKNKRFSRIRNVSERIYFIIQTAYMMVINARCIILSDNIEDTIVNLAIYFLLLLPLMDLRKIRTKIQYQMILAGIVLAISYIVAADTPVQKSCTGAILIVSGGILEIGNIIRRLFGKKFVLYGIVIIVMPVVLTVGYWRMFGNCNDPSGLFLQEKINDGPAAGIYTSSENKALYDNVYRLVSSLEHTEDDYIVTNEPLVLLMTDMKNGGGDLWGVKDSFWNTEQIYLTIYPEKKPRYVVIVGEPCAECLDFVRNNGYKGTRFTGGILYSL